MSAIELEQKLDAVAAENTELRTKLDAAQRQLDWFKRQLFGRKSEKLLDIDPAVQQSLLAGLVEDAPPAPDDSVPVRVIEVAAPAGSDAGDVEIIDTRSTSKLAQRRASFEVLEYRCPVLKHRDSGTLKSTPTPTNVLERSVADVSFLAGLLVDKFCFHLPLYRQHQRLLQAGIQLSRSTLTTLVGRAAALLAPIHLGQFEHVLTSHVLAMDETPTRVGRNKARGKMHQAWFWPLYGDADEISFIYANGRAKAHIEKTLDEHFQGVLLSDGYAAYASYAANRPGITHAQCWVHTRRGFEKALDADPQAEDALLLIADLYKQERWIRDKKLEGPARLEARVSHCEPRVRAFWKWCDAQCQRLDLEPSHPLSKALGYALARRESLEVFLGDPDVPLDTNHLERGLRPIPMGKKNWLFCWTEVGAEHVGIIQSLLSTCRLQGVDPYTYLVDVLQRVGRHPASRTAELTPRLWKEHFASNPLRSDIDHVFNTP